jgi:phosphatidylserine decarboxylase
VAEGQRLAVGERMAIIRFGSRVDLVLPEGSTSAVRVGQRVWGGTSVIGRLPSASPDG